MLRNSSLLSFRSNIDAMDNQDSLKLFTCEIGDCLATILARARKLLFLPGGDP